MSKLYYGIQIFHPNLCADSVSDSIIPLMQQGELVVDKKLAIKLTKEMQGQVGPLFQIILLSVVRPTELEVPV